MVQLTQIGQVCSYPGLLSRKAIEGYIEVLNEADNVPSSPEFQQCEALKSVFNKLMAGDKFESGKLNKCIEIVKQKMTQDPSNRVLVFIWFQELAQVMQKEFESLGYSSHIINGSTKKDRHKIVKQFNGIVQKNDIDSRCGKDARRVWDILTKTLFGSQTSDEGKLKIHELKQADAVDFGSPQLNNIVKEVLGKSLRPIILLNIKAAGEGINLQAGNVVIDYESWWNPAAMDQALGRAYRFGQKRTVEHYNLFSKEVHLDHLIQHCLNQKRLFQEFLLGEGDIDQGILKLRDLVFESLKQRGFQLVDESYAPEPVPLPLAQAPAALPLPLSRQPEPFMDLDRLLSIPVQNMDLTGTDPNLESGDFPSWLNTLDDIPEDFWNSFQPSPPLDAPQGSLAGRIISNLNKSE